MVSAFARTHTYLKPSNNQSSLSLPKNTKLKTPKPKPPTTMSQPRFTSTIFLSLPLLLLFIPNHNALLSPSTVDLNLLKHTEITKGVCNKSTIGEECLTEPEMDSEMDSENSRRVLLMQKKYISYETLRRDMVPCDRAGVSYYSCHAREANPYRRGCEVITACARGAQEINT